MVLPDPRVRPLETSDSGGLRAPASIDQDQVTTSFKFVEKLRTLDDLHGVGHEAGACAQLIDNVPPNPIVAMGAAKTGHKDFRLIL
jgi:hypothetical protein